MNPEHIMLSEISQPQRDTVLQEVSGVVKRTETERRMALARGWEESVGAFLLNGIIV